MKRYSASHEWVEIEGMIATVGISAFIQKELGNIVHVELPKKGQKLQKNEMAVVLESTKAATDVYSPLSGEVLDINVSLKNAPEKINHSAESEGWLYKIKVHNLNELETLLDENLYTRISGK